MSEPAEQEQEPADPRLAEQELIGTDPAGQGALEKVPAKPEPAQQVLKTSISDVSASSDGPNELPQWLGLDPALGSHDAIHGVDKAGQVLIALGRDHGENSTFLAIRNFMRAIRKSVERDYNVRFSPRHNSCLSLAMMHNIDRFSEWKEYICRINRGLSQWINFHNLLLQELNGRKVMYHATDKPIRGDALDDVIHKY